MNSKTHHLDSIDSPAELKELSFEQMEELAEEIRSKIISCTTENGGHLASNLGVVELTLAIHYVFNSPSDKILWDVGHQCYTHKLITGRRKEFCTIRQKGGISGFPRKKENIHDIMDTGHASTSISAGLGIAEGNFILESTNRVICIIGDGALSGGLAFEALNNASRHGKRLLIILNDNKMSISSNVGALSSYFSRLTSSHRYQTVRTTWDHIISRIPFIGKKMVGINKRFKRSVKGLLFRETLFSDLGLSYTGPVNGHSIKNLVKVFNVVGDSLDPVVVHVLTQKGKGYSEAEENPSKFHGVSPSGTKKGTHITTTEAFSEALLVCAEKDSRIVAVTAAMAQGSGLGEFSKRYPKRFFDVGIAEGHAVTFAAGLAVSGLIPIVTIYSTFIQRAVDHFIHDVALQNLPVIIMIDRAGFVPGDGETHQGIFDIALFKSIPNTLFLAPINKKEIALALDYALKQGQPTLIRYPKGECYPPSTFMKVGFDKGPGVFIKKGKESSILLVSLGGLLGEVVKCHTRLKRKAWEADLFHLRFIAPLSEEDVLQLTKNYRYVFFIEEGVASGGVGERFASILLSSGFTGHFGHMASPSVFHEQATREELIADNRLDGVSLFERIVESLEQIRLREMVELVKADKF